MSETYSLEQAVESWEQSVAYDRGQVRYDIATFGSGTLLLGLGIGAALCGVPEGLIAFAPGGLMSAMGLKDLKEDIERLTSSTTTLAARQQELRES